MERLRNANPEQAAALFRTILQVMGGIIATNGWMTESNWATVSGALLTIATTAWGIWARRDVALLTSAANVPSAVVVTPPEVAQVAKNKDVITPLEVKARGIVPVLALALLLPFLGACTTVRANVAPTAPVIQTRADVAVARASAELVKYCNYARPALAAAGLFASREITVRAIEMLEAAVEEYCETPPTDVVTALGVLQRAYVSVLQAQRT